MEEVFLIVLEKDSTNCPCLLFSRSVRRFHVCLPSMRPILTCVFGILWMLHWACRVGHLKFAVLTNLYGIRDAMSEVSDQRWWGWALPARSWSSTLLWPDSDRRWLCWWPFRIQEWESHAWAMVVMAEIGVWNKVLSELRGGTSHIFHCLLMRNCFHVLLPASVFTFPNSEQFHQLLATGAHCCLAMRAPGCVESAQPSFLPSKQARSERHWPGADGAFPSEALQAVLSINLKNSTPHCCVSLWLKLLTPQLKGGRSYFSSHFQRVLVYHSGEGMSVQPWPDGARNVRWWLFP